ncbi:MAG: hypothetical protein ACC652_08690, partial [Acidimicrobiales bacterium]
ESMEFCTSCGTKLAEGAEHCGNCGSALDTAAAEPSQPSFLAQPEQTPYPVQESKNGLALAAMILGIVGLVLFWTIALGVILGALALIFGLIGRKRAKAAPGNVNAGKALAGIILGAGAIAASLLFLYAIRDDVSNAVRLRDVELSNLDCSDLGIEAQVRWTGGGLVDVTFEGQALSASGGVVFSEEVVVTDLSDTPETLTVAFPDSLGSGFDQCQVTPIEVE